MLYHVKYSEILKHFLLSFLTSSMCNVQSDQQASLLTPLQALSGAPLQMFIVTTGESK